MEYKELLKTETQLFKNKDEENLADLRTSIIATLNKMNQKYLKKHH